MKPVGTAGLQRADRSSGSARVARTRARQPEAVARNRRPARARDQWRGFARRAGHRPRVWLHAASAGETLQARPIGDDPPAIPTGRCSQLLSPSAERLAASWDAPDHADYRLRLAFGDARAGRAARSRRDRARGRRAVAEPDLDRGGSRRASRAGLRPARRGAARAAGASADGPTLPRARAIGAVSETSAALCSTSACRGKRWP